MPSKIHDISVSISRFLPVFPGDPPVEVKPRIRISRGAPCNVSQLILGSHTGTHIDAPYHFEDSGKTVDELSLDVLVGPCKVFAMPDVRAITATQIAKLDLRDTSRVLFKTRNGRLWGKGFCRSFTYLTPDGAKALVEKGVRLVGIDYLSVEKFGSKDFATHHTLLRRNVVILEGLDLSKIKPGNYTLVALPLKIAGGDGSPARVVLIDR